MRGRDLSSGIMLQTIISSHLHLRLNLKQAHLITCQIVIRSFRCLFQV